MVGESTIQKYVKHANCKSNKQIRIHFWAHIMQIVDYKSAKNADYGLLNTAHINAVFEF